jgi:hypothetical protein
MSSTTTKNFSPGYTPSGTWTCTDVRDVWDPEDLLELGCDREAEGNLLGCISISTSAPTSMGTPLGPLTRLKVPRLGPSALNARISSMLAPTTLPRKPRKMEGGLVIHVMFSQKLSGPPPPFDALIQSSSWDLLPVHCFIPAASAAFNFFNFLFL